MISTFRSVAAALVAALALIASGANAQSNYPNKPIRLVVIFPAGGTADILARTIGQKLTERWGQQVVVDNRPGAGGNLATEIVAKAAPDGYTILLGGLTTHGINPSLYRKLPYDPVKDFAPVTLAAATPLVLVVNPSLPVQSMQELVLLAKSRPREFNFASFGNGTSGHLCGVLFNSMAGIEMTHVAYKGSPAAVADLVAGRVQVMFDAIPVALPQIKAGRLKALAVTDSRRSNALPEVPTVEEAGLPGFQVVGWLGFFAPAAVPKEIVHKLSAEIVTILNMPDVRERLTNLGMEPKGNTPGEFAAFVDSELKKWAPVVKASGAQID